jgi:hypothetical protein
MWTFAVQANFSFVLCIYRPNCDLVLSFFSTAGPLVSRADKRLTKTEGPFGEQQAKVTTFEHKEGKLRPRVLWEHLPDKFAQSYSGADTVFRVAQRERPTLSKYYVSHEWGDVRHASTLGAIM